MQWLSDNKLTQFIREVDPQLEDGTIPTKFNPQIRIDLTDFAIIYRSHDNPFRLFYNPNTDAYDKDLLHEDLATSLTSSDFLEVVKSTLKLIPTNKT